MLDFQKLSAQYQQALLRQVVPFWLKHSQDELCGGYFDMLTATGDSIDGDKFVALQAQQTWAFAWLYNAFDGQSTWLQHARHGADFLSQFVHDDTLNCYAQVDRRGRLVAPSNSVIPDSFVTMGYAQFHRATGEDEWAMLAKQTLSNILERRETIRIEQSSTIGAFREIRHLSEPLAVLKTLLEMRLLLDEEDWKQSVEVVLQEILNEFVDRRIDVLREYVLPEGTFVNTPEGRRINVGLVFQTANYLLDLYSEITAQKIVFSGIVNRKLITQIVSWCLSVCEQGWDETTAGLKSYLDLKDQPTIFPDWQQKWAWVHTEALLALLKCYINTQNNDCLKWFKRIHDYTFQHFPDAKHIGWHLAIDAQAQPLLPAKATPSVGCYSQIRGLTEIAQLLPKCDQIKPVRQIGRAGISLNS
ncbi:AGE family epimerase/isomerase [Spirosoma harenae]